MKGYRHLTQGQRYIIEAMLKRQRSYREIGEAIGVSASTISREIRRNGRTDGGYTGKGAHSNARTRWPNRWDCKRKIEGWLKEAIVRGLELRWSPRLISGRLKLEGKQSVSHETIYRWIWWNKAYGANIHTALRFKGRRKRRRYGSLKRFDPRYSNRRSIEERPKEADERKEIGHWERDLIEGANHKHAILSFIERKSRYVTLSKIGSKCPKEVDDKSIKIIETHRSKFNTLTNDNGFEFMNHEELSKKTKVPIYFTHPYSSWERGSIENINGLVRQFLPKGTDFKAVSAEDVKQIESILNQRPKIILKYRTPFEIFFGVKQKLFSEKKNLEIALRC